jgi:NodT family efflux transporter outer membrane factor (OMF) lipoprotein
VKWRVLFLLSPATVLLTACKVGPDYDQPDTFTEARWADPLPGAATDREVVIDWWNNFDDPLLTDLINRAVEGNRNLRAAEARVLRARALRGETAAGQWPTLDVEGSHSRQRSSGTLGTQTFGGSTRSVFDVGLGASWEIDLFGGNRRATEADQARLESEIERRRATLLSLLAETARTYHEVRGIQKRIAITENNIRLQSQTFELVENLFRLGEASEFDISRARGQLRTTEARLPVLDAALRGGIFRLSVLIGEVPNGLLDELMAPGILPATPDLIPVGQSSDLLRRRPDIRAAERQLAAATADIGAATADLFPRFSLIGGLGRASGSSSGLRESDSNRYNLTQFVQWPVFSAGALRAAVDSQSAEAEEAAALYEQTVLEALAETESTLVAYLRERETGSILRDAVASRQRAVELARTLFNGGEEDFLAVLDAERELITAEDELVTSETNALLQLITLYTALGGGWQAFEFEE